MIHVEMRERIRCQQRVGYVDRQQFTKHAIAMACRHLLLHLHQRNGARQTAAIHHWPRISIRIQQRAGIFHAICSGEHLLRRFGCVADNQ